MFKEYIKNNIDKWFNEMGQDYRVMALIPYNDALGKLKVKEQFELDLKEAGYRINGGFVERTKKND